MDLKIPLKLSREIESFCTANKIEDIDGFVLKVLKDGFNLEKWGDINYKEVEEVKPIIKEPEIIENFPEPIIIKSVKVENIPEPYIKPKEIIQPEPIPKLTTETIKPPKPIGNIIEKIRPRIVERTKNNDIYNED